MTKEYRQPVYAPPKGATEILLVRHGESQPALPGQSFPMVDGHGDPALHPNGHTQAQAVGERLRNETLAAIYVTTLQRTHQTAAPLAAHLGLTPIVEPDLREVCLGNWDGGEYRIKAAERHPIILKAFENEEFGEIPNAETTAQLQARVMVGINRLAARHPDERIAAVVHGGVIAAILSVASGSRPFAFMGSANGSLSHIVMHDSKITIRGFNDCAHLQGLDLIP